MSLDTWYCASGLWGPSHILIVKGICLQYLSFSSDAVKPEPEPELYFVRDNSLSRETFNIRIYDTIYQNLISSRRGRVLATKEQTGSQY